MNISRHNMLNVIVWAIVTGLCTSAFGGTMSSDHYYTWGISGDDLDDIQPGSIITEAVLTIQGIQGITNWDNNLHMHIVDNPPLDFVANIDDDSGDFFQDFGGLLSGDSYEFDGEDLIITFSDIIDDENSWVWDIFDYPFDNFQLADSSFVSYSSSLLELIDYAGNGTPFGIGFDPDGSNYIYAQMTLKLTVKSYEGSVLEQTHVFTPAWSPHSISVLETNKAVYSIGEEIVVDFQNASGDAMDWIGIYQAGAADDDFIYWLRTDGAKAGTTDITGGSVTFTNGSLDSGDYEVRLFFNNSYKVEATSQFSVEEGTAVETDKLLYASGENIIVTFTDASGNSLNWIGLYNTGANNTQILAWKHTGGVASGSVTFTNGLLDAGEYEARLFFNNSYDLEATGAFTIQ